MGEKINLLPYSSRPSAETLCRGVNLSVMHSSGLCNVCCTAGRASRTHKPFSISRQAAFAHAAQEPQRPPCRARYVSKLAGFVAASIISFGGCSHAAEKVGDFPASGILFKDSVETLAIDDPDVKGVTIYISDFKRNLKDKISNMGNEPSSASVTCAVTGPIEIQDASKIKGISGEDVFSEKRGLGFIQNKTLHVRRVFDEAHKTLLYVAYSTRFTNDKEETPGRYKTSVCALPISSQVAPVEKTSSNDQSGLFSPVKNTS